MIAVAVQFDDATLPQAVGTNELNVSVSFPRINITPTDGRETEILEAYGNGTTSITKSELIGKEVLYVTTDGRSRSRLKNEFTFVNGNATGLTTFPSAIQTTQVIQWVYK